MGAFDVVVLGGGTAGVHVATEGAGGGKAVALVEAGLLGGESPYLACLPSNSLLLSAAQGVTWEDAVVRRTEVTGGLDDSAAARRLNRAGVTVIRGTGRITAPGTAEVTLAPDPDAGPDRQGGGGPPPAGGPARPPPAAGAGRRGYTPLLYSVFSTPPAGGPAAPPIEGLADIPA